MYKVVLVLAVVLALGLTADDAQSACVVKAPNQQLDLPFLFDPFLFFGFTLGIHHPTNDLISDYPPYDEIKRGDDWVESMFGDPTKTKRTKKTAKRKRKTTNTTYNK